MIIIDIIASIFQSIAFAYITNYCVSKEVKKIKLALLTLSFVFIGMLFTEVFGNNGGMSIFITHILAIAVVAIFYKKNIINALTSYTIIYSIFGIYTMIFGNLIFEYVSKILPVEYVNQEIISIIYFPQLILIGLCFKYKEKIKQVHKLIMIEGFSVSALIISFVLDFIITFYIVRLGKDNQLLKNVIYLVFFLFFIVILIYFWKVKQKSDQIYKLNEALEIKNNELRKIKHDYGAQISYLYGLCLMGRFDDLKVSLKNIINNNEATPTAVEVTKNEKSLLSLALKPAIEKGIHVIIEEKCTLNLIDMTEMEFYRVVSNIVNNAISAMNGQGIIIVKSYEYLGSVVIKIENNGPKIEEYHLKDIFKIGFTTKDNTDKSHGYGLSIVKELIENYNGKIYVKSTDAATEFKIVLPIKNEKVV
ncbi:globin-coupled histidine kinase [Clostridium puniceum]|uniref:histidine kinase n=1 Tax=Clostridium puniceum TaxID=29367 RepID=A0A1S8TRI1_9CLOT|nr:ATP-binding protein [Clostridium puniceum]OOM80284.1 globin-coupled histidine kinase [Clostridium puniceum]